MNLAKYIDHTLRSPTAQKEEILKLCSEADQYGFFSVCVQPSWVSTSAEALKDSEVKVCTVIGFPHGATSSETKAFETKNAIENGADEIDMVINLGQLKDGNLDYVKSDIQSVVDAANKEALVKVIIESSLLTDEEIKTASRLSKEAGADFVKTSTGFNGAGASVEAVKIMRQTVGEDLGVKASGGVRSKEDADAMITAGATRIGASSGIAIVEGAVSDFDY